MDKWIAYTIACGLSFLEFGLGVYVAAVPYGDILAGSVLAVFGLTVFGAGIAAILQENTPRAQYSTLAHLYERQTPARPHVPLQPESPRPARAA